MMAMRKIFLVGTAVLYSSRRAGETIDAAFEVPIDGRDELVEKLL
jgi:hypothetical protein